ncbi:MAG: hypothetical protein ABW252_10890 [Polyangiales bacterium]
MSEADRSGVVLPGGVGGSGLLHALLARAVDAFPQALGPLRLPDPAGLRTRYAALIPRFEWLRRESAERCAIARFLVRESTACLRFGDAEGERDLADALASEAAPLPLERVALPSQAGFTPKVALGGRVFAGEQLDVVATQLARRHLATQPAVDALRSLGARVREAGVSLRGERFVLLGAGAELSPVYALLEAGADVLWLDVVPPPIDHLLDPRLGGTLAYVPGGVDLLARPAEVRATVLAFAAGGPVRIGMYAFANGGARAARLALTMNALVRSLPSGTAASLHYALSPTSVSPVSPEDARRADDRRARDVGSWRTRLRARAFAPAHLGEGMRRLSACVVSAQGASYQVAEYVGKRLAAEAFLAYGSGLDGAATRAPLAVTADMLPICTTRSLDNPVLAAAVLGAPRFDMLISAPDTAAGVGASLLVEALLAPPTNDHDAREGLFARQFHGGALAQPYALDGLIRRAALRGMAQRPKLALELLR